MADRVTRTFTLPIRAIEEPADVKIIDTFRSAWRLSTDLANWCQRQLALYDPGLRQPNQTKMVKYDPRCFPGNRQLYTHITETCGLRPAFDGAAGSMGAIIRAVEDAWKGHPKFGRYSVMWKGEARACLFRYPYPWPVRAQELRLLRTADGTPQASLTLPGGRLLVTLARGRDFDRQNRQFDILLDDISRAKQAKICARWRVDKLVGADLRIVGEFDVVPNEGTHTAFVHSDPHALLVAEIDGRQPWIINHDHIRRWQIAHTVFLQRTHEDMKREKRMDAQQKKNLYKARRLRCVKHHDRMETALKQAAAQLVRFCERQRVGYVVYDDSIRSYFPKEFQWANLKDTVRHKLEFIGVEFDAPEDQEPTPALPLPAQLELPPEPEPEPKLEMELV